MPQEAPARRPSSLTGILWRRQLASPEIVLPVCGELSNPVALESTTAGLEQPRHLGQYNARHPQTGNRRSQRSLQGSPPDRRFSQRTASCNAQLNGAHLRGEEDRLPDQPLQLSRSAIAQQTGITLRYSLAPCRVPGTTGAAGTMAPAACRWRAVSYLPQELAHLQTSCLADGVHDVTAGEMPAGMPPKHPGRLARSIAARAEAGTRERSGG